MIKIGFLGPKGTFSQEALLQYTRCNSETRYSQCEYLNINDILLAVESCEIEEAIVPMENSIEGAVNATMDSLVSSNSLLIKSEVVIEISQNLIIKKGTDAKKIDTIISHPQAIGQCRKYLGRSFPKAKIKYAYSTAEGAILTLEGNGEIASIGSKVSAQEYGLDIFEPDIQDVNNNLTRFVVVSKNYAVRTGKDKTSIAFSTEDKPGCLYRILDIFNLWDINLSRIESRPSKNKFGEYIFFVDISGHMDDDDVRDSLTLIKRKTSFYKFLGSYPEFFTD
jgi:prephenate dehydratase